MWYNVVNRGSKHCFVYGNLSRKVCKKAKKLVKGLELTEILRIEYGCDYRF